MKIVRYEAGGRTRMGVLEGSEVVELDGAASAQEFIAGGDAALAAARKAVASGKGRQALAGVKLLAPIVPSTILCSGSNYTDHNKEKANTPISGKEPEFFVKTADCVIGPGDAIAHDERLAKKLDSETELAIVIGKPGRFIPQDKALEHVFGYTIVNDVTARDRQVRRTPQGVTWYELGRGKAFDCSAPIGPCITTADEIPDPQALRLRTRINGDLRQSASTANMIWNCAQLVHFFSVNFTLKPGMVIITGTPGGTAWSVDPELGGKWIGGDGDEKLTPAKGYLKPGDVIECEMEKIGVLTNPVRAAA
jgi:2-keto-4-pentenoate hydratase/2-oxohepta-3-ene-1,7-dioic acid hydratase in catechol pathway